MPGDESTGKVTAGNPLIHKMLELVNYLRMGGVPVHYNYKQTNSVTRHLRAAQKLKAKLVLFLGTTELEQDSFTIKNLDTGEQQLVPRKDLISYCEKENK